MRGTDTGVGLNTYHVWLAVTMLLVFHLAYYCDGKRELQFRLTRI